MVAISPEQLYLSSHVGGHGSGMRMERGIGEDVEHQMERLVAFDQNALMQRALQQRRISRSRRRLRFQGYRNEDDNESCRGPNKARTGHTALRTRMKLAVRNIPKYASMLDKLLVATTRLHNGGHPIRQR